MRAVRDSWWARVGTSGSLSYGATALLLVLLSIAGLGTIAGWLFLGAVVILSSRFAMRGNGAATLSSGLWCWMTAPELRRFADWNSAFHSQSPVLLAPYAMSLIVLLTAATSRSRGVASATLAFSIAVLLTLYSTAISLPMAGIASTLVGALDWLAPIGLGLAVLNSSTRYKDLANELGRFSAIFLPAVSAYALIQWVVAPEWDRFWLTSIATAGSSFGQPEPFELRIWGTLDGPGSFAGVLVWLVLWRAATITRWWSVGSVALGLAAIGLSAVRGAYITLALATLICLLVGTFRVGKVAGMLAAVGLALLVIGGPVSAVLATRLQSFSSGSSDQSAAARTQFQEAQFPLVLSNPIGSGVASTGAGARVSAASSVFSNTDSGYLEVLKVFGSVPGGILLAALLVAWLLRATAIKTVPPIVSVTISGLLVLPVNLVLGSVLSGVIGTMAWIALGFAGRRDVPDRNVILASVPLVPSGQAQALGSVRT